MIFFFNEKSVHLTALSSMHSIVRSFISRTSESSDLWTPRFLPSSLCEVHLHNHWRKAKLRPNQSDSLPPHLIHLPLNFLLLPSQNQFSLVTSKQRGGSVLLGWALLKCVVLIS